MPLSDPNVSPVVTQTKAPGLLPRSVTVHTWREGADERVPHKKHTLKKKEKEKKASAGWLDRSYLLDDVSWKI